MSRNHRLSGTDPLLLNKAQGPTTKTTQRPRGSVAIADRTPFASTQGRKAQPSSVRSMAADLADAQTGSPNAALLGARAGRWNVKGAVLVTASSVEAAVRKNDGSISRPEHAALVDELDRALGKHGPLGALGPLAALGPIGRQPWNPSRAIKEANDALGDRAVEWAEARNASGGPGSDKGPLGPDGPLSKKAYEDVLPALGPNSRQLQAGGMFAAVGPLGALGALGPLGYAGPAGGTGLVENENGELLDHGRVRRTITIPYGKEKREVELVEYYRADFAKTLEDNDTSWIVRGAAREKDPAGDVFPFSSKRDQFVTLTVVPERLNDTFKLELLDDRGAVIATSDSDRYVNWIQVQADAGRKLHARVTLKKTGPLAPELFDPRAAAVLGTVGPLAFWSSLFFGGGSNGEDASAPHGFRLVCVGSAPYVEDTEIAGDHQARFCWLPNAGKEGPDAGETAKR